MSFPFRTELVAENTIFLDSASSMERKTLELSQFLKKIFGLSVLPPAEVCDCLALQFLSNLSIDKRVEQFCSYLLENYIDADSTFPSPVWSECSASSLRTINACELFHAHFNALFYSAHDKIFVFVSELQKIHNATYIKMRSVTPRRFRKTATFKQEDLTFWRRNYFFNFSTPCI